MAKKTKPKKKAAEKKQERKPVPCDHKILIRKPTTSVVGGMMVRDSARGKTTRK